MKVTIMAGGQGTRFWPLSREACPKQFLPLAGSRTMLQETVQRLYPLLKPEDIFIVCGRQYAGLVRRQLTGLTGAQLIVEPVPRNTAPCIGLAALRLKREFGNTVMAVLPADHAISDIPEFHAVLAAGAVLAEQGWLVTFGIEPSFPSTGYGYIHRAEPIGEYLGKRSFRVKGFTEKPGADLAARFLASDEYYWNSGMFVWTTETILEQFRLHMPELHEILLEIDRDWGKAGTLESAFAAAPRISIDFGVMEKAERVCTIPCRLGWSDVGNWRAAEELLCRDTNGIASNTKYSQYDSRDCLLHSDSGKLIALVGVQDLIVVDTGDVVLVCHRSQAEQVKQVVEELRRNGPREYL